MSPIVHAFITNVSNIEIPKDIEKSLKVPKWKQIVLEEKLAFEKNETWEIVKKLEEKTLVGCKWVFIVKYNSNGEIDHYKAILVSKGFTQT